MKLIKIKEQDYVRVVKRKIFVPYSVLYTSAVDGDIDFAKINELQREDRRINKGQSARKGVYLNVDQLNI